MSFLAKWLDRFFEISERDSSLQIEMLAGVSTFLTLAYIVVVNPAILSAAGFDKSAVFFATVVVSAIATIGMGLWARLPFALAPGLEMDGYVAFFVVGVLGFGVSQALGIVFWSTMIFFFLSVLGFREKIIDCIPLGMKHALSTAIGVFVAMIGFKLAGVVLFDGASPYAFGSFTEPQAIALYIGVGVILACNVVNFRGGILVSIVVVSIYCSIHGLSEGVEPINVSADMLALGFSLDLSVIFDQRAWAPILILFLVDFYGSVAKIIGLTVNTNLYDQSSGKPINTSQGLYVDGVAAAISPLVGTSSVTTFVESAVGIQAGGRTGITAIVCGILMLLTFFLAPLLSFVPVVATSGALVVVGWWLLPKPDVRKHFTHIDWFVAIGMGGMAAVSFSLEKSMLLGYTAYVVHSLWKRRIPSLYLVASLVVLAVGVWLRISAPSL